MLSASHDELALHKRLIDRDETASAEVFEWYLEPMIDALARYNPVVAARDATVIWDAVTRALFDYVDNPEKYDPYRMGQREYLWMSAERDLKNSLAKHRRRERKKESLDELVELRGDFWNSLLREEADPEMRLEVQEIRGKIREIFDDERDREIAEMTLVGIRKTEHYAEVLDIDHLSVEEQRKEVKRAKDRIKKALSRADWSGFFHSEE